MNKNTIVIKTRDYVRGILQGEGSGHDWRHVQRVWKTAIRIAREEGADRFIVELAALLHDLADWKACGGDQEAGPAAARQWLSGLGMSKDVIDHVCDIVRNVSFKGAGVKSKIKTIEGKAVQDADRLDAMGAIGIARAFAYGGHRGREIHDPRIKPRKHRTFEQYKKSRGPTINHFYEKLLLLKDLMNTRTAGKLACGRHEFMKEYLDRFYGEWNGNK